MEHMTRGPIYDEDDCIAINLDQISRSLNKMVYDHVQVFKSKLKAHGVPDDKIKLAYSEYVEHCKVTGVYPKGNKKGIKVGDTPSLISRSSAPDLQMTKRLNLNANMAFVYQGVDCFVSSSEYEDGIFICANMSHSVMCLWEQDTNEIIPITNDIKQYLHYEGYRISPTV